MAVSITYDDLTNAIQAASDANASDDVKISLSSIDVAKTALANKGIDPTKYNKTFFDFWGWGPDKLFTALVKGIVDTFSSTASSNMKFTSEGGLAVLLMNDTGSPTVKGTLVDASSAHSLAFVITGSSDSYPSDFMPIGVVYDSGVANGSQAWIVISGVAQCLLQDGLGSTAGNWVGVSSADYSSGTPQPGRVDAALSGPPGGGIGGLLNHFLEVGHCLETKSAGVRVLARCIIHFN